MKFNYLYILIFIVSFSTTTFGQENAIIEKIDGKKYFMHNVEPGETLYSISKQYRVPIPIIIENNPSIKQGLKIDELLKIPVAAQEKPKKEAEFVQNKIEKGILYHRVEPKETLYGISKKFGVPVNEVLAMNEEAIDGLKVGQVLKIPVGRKYTSEANNTDKPIEKPKVTKPENIASEIIDIEEEFAEEIDTIPLIPKHKEVYNIALFLPFYLDENDTINAHMKPAEKEFVYKKSKIAISIYKGVRFAFDSLTKLGFKGNLYTYDTNNDLETVDSLLQLPEMKQMDVFIGPLYRSSFEKVSKFAKTNGQLIVSPVPQSNKILLDNEHVFKVSPSNPIHISRIIEEVTERHKDANILVVNNFEGKDIKMVDQVLKEGNQKLFATTDTFVPDSIQELYLKVVNTRYISEHLSKEKENVIIIPSNNQAFVSDFLIQLNNTDTTFKKTVFGLEKWQYWDNIDVDYLHNLNVHITSSIFYNYNSEDYKNLTSNFVKKYYCTPTKYECIGNSVGMYFFNALQKGGLNFYNNKENLTYEGPACRFEFFKTSLESGYENGFVYLLKYEDYELKEVTSP